MQLRHFGTFARLWPSLTGRVLKRRHPAWDRKPSEQHCVRVTWPLDQSPSHRTNASACAAAVPVPMRSGSVHSVGGWFSVEQAISRMVNPSRTWGLEALFHNVRSSIGYTSLQTRVQSEPRHPTVVAYL
ncbi:hypothetical protein M8818_000660 [Zalaria obscura]|uniref:Uncharacterized protein n=1 Tax=Zalaria obscura TaxID=2024903 RepID=A0ACC3SMF2_9PEZI